MDTFPEDFNKTVLYNKMERAQEKLIKDTRRKFHEEINESVTNCSRTVSLIVPDNMWNKYRVILVTELIARFGELRVYTDKLTHGTTRLIDNTKDIPRYVNKIELEYWNETV